MKLILLDGQPKKESVSNIMRQIAKKKFGGFPKQITPFPQLQNLKRFEYKDQVLWLVFIDNRINHFDNPILKFGNYEFHAITEKDVEMFEKQVV